MKEKKYDFTGISIVIKYNNSNIRVHQIRALRDFGEVKAGDIGGWIQSEENLSHEGNCWIFKEAAACQNSRVLDDAEMHDFTEAYDNAVLRDRAKMYCASQATKNAILSGDMKLDDLEIASGSLN